jgi:hypothetical protein
MRPMRGNNGNLFYYKQVMDDFSYTFIHEAAGGPGMARRIAGLKSQ